MSLARIAVSGVVRAWDGNQRTGVNAAYVRALLLAGGVPLILSPLMGASLAAAALDGCDGLLLTGGEDIEPSWYGADPSPLLEEPSQERDLFELALFAVARQRALPILGICRGIQLINVALGGTLFQDLPSERPGTIEHSPKNARDARTHVVRVQPGSRAALALGAAQITVNSVHHQAIKESGQGSGRDRLEQRRINRSGRKRVRRELDSGGSVAPRRDACRSERAGARPVLRPDQRGESGRQELSGGKTERRRDRSRH